MVDSYQEVAARMRRGTITGWAADRRLLVRAEWSDQVFTCDVLRLIAGPRLEYPVGTGVLFLASDDEQASGYILGALSGGAS